MARRYILSIDGGGIRGILPATALVELERTTGRRTRDIFAFAAGTSTGALLSAAVAAGIEARQILDVYLKRGREIFTPRPPWNTIKRLATGSMYSTRKLNEVVGEALGAARHWTLNDSPIDLLLTAKGLDGTPWYFVKDKPKNFGSTGRLRLLDCATASAAAPTYFQPWKITGAPPPPKCPPVPTLVDGGVGVTGNPVYQACVEAFYYTGEYTPEETTVVSLGTGRFPLADEEPRGLFRWLEWILGELLRSPGEQQTEITRRHFPPQMLLFRLDPDIGKLDPALKKPIDMDDVEAIPRLEAYGRQFAETIDWEAILAGTDPTFRITDRNTQWEQYKRA